MSLVFFGIQIGICKKNNESFYTRLGNVGLGCFLMFCVIMLCFGVAFYGVFFIL
jgi:hypothetical protein